MYSIYFSKFKQCEVYLRIDRIPHVQFILFSCEPITYMYLHSECLNLQKLIVQFWWSCIVVSSVKISLSNVSATCPCSIKLWQKRQKFSWLTFQTIDLWNILFRIEGLPVLFLFCTYWFALFFRSLQDCLKFGAFLPGQPRAEKAAPPAPLTPFSLYLSPSLNTNINNTKQCPAGYVPSMNGWSVSTSIV